MELQLPGPSGTQAQAAEKTVNTFYFNCHPENDQFQKPRDHMMELIRMQTECLVYNSVCLNQGHFATTGSGFLASCAIGQLS